MEKIKEIEFYKQKIIEMVEKIKNPKILIKIFIFIEFVK